MKNRKSKLSGVQNNENQEYSAIKNLNDAEIGLQSYSVEIVNKIAKEFAVQKFDKVKIVEFGAGTGALADIWRSEFGISPTCIEIDPNLTGLLKSKGFEVYNQISKINQPINYLYTSNVLEHIEDDLSTLISIRQKMSTGGLLIIYVPALPILYSDHDKSIGHYRRYGKKELKKKVEYAGFEVKNIYWNDSLGILAALAVKVFGWKGSVGLGTKKSFIVYDKYIYPISKILDRLLFRKIIGKNLFLFAQAK
jgi:hypothetical protein